MDFRQQSRRLSNFPRSRLDRLVMVLLEHESKSGCLMVRFDPALDELVQSLHQQISDDDVYHGTEDDPGYGLEDDPHVTVLYGFDPDLSSHQIQGSSETVCDLCSIGDPEVFENDSFDVVYLPVYTSSWLDDLHNSLKDEFSVESKFPDYRPHITIAYVKKGQGHEIADGLQISDDFLSSQFQPSEMVWSANGNKDTWPVECRTSDHVSDLLGD